MRATLLSPILSAFLLLAAACAPAHAQRAALPGLTEGVEYKLIEGGKPYRAVPGKIEVAEVFAKHFTFITPEALAACGLDHLIQLDGLPQRERRAASA